MLVSIPIMSVRELSSLPEVVGFGCRLSASRAHAFAITPGYSRGRTWVQPGDAGEPHALCVQ